MAAYLLNLLFWAAVAFVLVFWWKTLGIKQQAYRIVSRRCDEVGVQLLDQSVQLSRLSLRRGRGGTLSILRSFVFEFSTSGDERYRGRVEMLGQRLHSIEFEPYRS